MPISNVSLPSAIKPQDKHGFCSATIPFYCFDILQKIPHRNCTFVAVHYHTTSQYWILNGASVALYLTVCALNMLMLTKPLTSRPRRHNPYKESQFWAQSLGEVTKCVSESHIRGRPSLNNDSTQVSLYVGLMISLWIFLFTAQPKEFFLDGLKKLEQRSHKCVEFRGKYVE
jgi:hypothetical protein